MKRVTGIGGILAAVAGIFRAGGADQRRRHGSGQLGHGSPGGRIVPLSAFMGRPSVERDGDRHADHFCAPGDRHAQGSGPGLSRFLSGLVALAQLACL